MLLTLPGLPLLYTGDEVGAEFEPYDEGPVLSWKDYARLVALRRDHVVLRSERLEILATSADLDLNDDGVVDKRDLDALDAQQVRPTSSDEPAS